MESLKCQAKEFGLLVRTKEQLDTNSREQRFGNLNENLFFPAVGIRTEMKLLYVISLNFIYVYICLYLPLLVSEDISHLVTTWAIGFPETRLCY